MAAEQTLTTMQEQGHASWKEWLNRIRSNEPPERFALQKVSLEQTLAELKKMKIDTAGIENARSLIKGLDAVCEWIGENGPMDPVRCGVEMQQKFMQNSGHLRLDAAKEHLEEYPEGGIAFCLGILEKRKQGKRLYEFTERDWREVGIDTIMHGIYGPVGVTYKKEIRGANIYKMANFTTTPAAVANAYVTAAFGVAAQACQLRQGNITEEDFIVNSEVLCLDVSVSTITAVLGPMLIRDFYLGKIIDYATSMFMDQIAKRHLSAREQTLIANNRGDFDLWRDEELIVRLEEEFARFSSGLELAFDMDVNDAFVVHMVRADNDKQEYYAEDELLSNPFKRGPKNKKRKSKFKINKKKHKK